MENNKYIVILAGGGGTRLWPKSRKALPKQFLKLFGEQTLLQITYERVKEFVPNENIFIVTSGNFKQTVSEQLDLPEENILIEPVAAGTTAAVGLAAVYIRARNPEAIISTIASDHYIPEPDEFLDSLKISQKSAEQGDHLVTMGLAPTSAHTGFGYIHAGDKTDEFDGQQVYLVSDFAEKPDKATAEKYLKSSEYFWNANINSYSVETIFKSFQQFTPELSQALEKISSTLGSSVEDQIIADLWGKFETEPIDTAILEKAKNVLMVKANFTWLDIGDWGVLHDLLSEEKSENVVIGDQSMYIMEGSNGSLIHTDSRLIATIGVDDLVIIDTPDVLLITKKDKAQDVKKIVEKLRENDRERLL